jgi:lysyl-tRNA synthetase class 1
VDLQNRWIAGCGFNGEVDIKKGEGKLSWKGEFAVRWKALDIRFEAYGKDIADSVRINDRICREILLYEPPSHAKYEMFLDKSGKKISKSRGNVFTPQVWFRYGSPQSLLLLMLKRFVGTRTLGVTDIPFYMHELDYLEDLYFGKKTVKDTKELAKLQGLYKYCWHLNPPKTSSIHVPFNLLVFLGKMAPTGGEEEFLTEKLQIYGYLPENKTVDERFRKRLEYTSNWVKDFEEITETKILLKTEEKTAVKELITILHVENDVENIQNAVFNIAKKNGLRPANFFKILYHILIGVTHGPRLGPYVITMGRQNVIRALQRALK